MLVQKMKKEVKASSLDLEVAAYPLAEANNRVDEADIILLGPQVGFEKAKMEKKVAGRVPVDVINMRDYGTMNAKKVLSAAIKKMEEHK